MKKVSVITFFQSKDNYGQLLQCFALQETLKRLGAIPEVIRYGFHYKYIHWFKLTTYTTKAGVKEILYLLRLKKQPLDGSIRRDRKFDLFRKKYLTLSHKKYNSLEELRKSPPIADCYITGSDQVWAQLLNIPDNRSFFLDFGSPKVKRVAYAPSFALDNYPKNLFAELKSNLDRLDAVSVRENRGVEICRIVGHKAQVVLDPTLLLSPKDYDHIAIIPNVKNYCFVYHVNVYSPEDIRWKETLRYNERCGLKTIAAYANPTADVDMEFLKEADYKYPTIPEWIGWIKEADYVLTSSYHGVIFSIIYHIPFIVCLRKQSLFAGNDRIHTLLGSLQLENRIITDNSTFNAILSQQIDWIKVDYQLSIMQKESLYFLEKNI